jgi:hypothetical protein
MAGLRRRAGSKVLPPREEKMNQWNFDEEQIPRPKFGGGKLPFLVITINGCELIHVCGNGKGQSRRDARLIAAAPELVEALKQTIAVIEAVHRQHPDELWLGSEYQFAKETLDKS